jgi:hypothetical protein
MAQLTYGVVRRAELASVRAAAGDDKRSVAVLPAEGVQCDLKVSRLVQGHDHLRIDQYVRVAGMQLDRVSVEDCHVTELVFRPSQT